MDIVTDMSLQIHMTRLDSVSSLSRHLDSQRRLLSSAIYNLFSKCSKVIISLHRQNTPKPDLSAHHVVQSLLHLLQRELLDHAFHTLPLRKRDCLFRVESMTRRPPVDGQALQDERPSVDGNITHWRQDQHFAPRRAAVNQRSDNLWIRRRHYDQRSAAHLL